MSRSRVHRITRSLMRPEFPWLYARASIVVATPTLCLVLLFYIQRAVGRDPAEVFPLGIAAFGVTAAFAGICYTVPTSNVTIPSAGYAAEKFLHASILLIQSLMLVFIRHAAIAQAASWHQPWKGVALALGAFAGAIASLVAATAVWSWYWGFEAVNSELWRNWQSRIDKRVEAFDRKTHASSSLESGGGREGA